MASLFHPLCGSNPETLMKLLWANGPVALNRCPQIAIALMMALARWPFSTVEQWIFNHTQKHRPPMADPIFIVGYWRSGTTHLHNLLAQSQHFGYITPLATGLPWDILGLVRAFEPLLEKALPSDRYVDNVAVTPNSPQEDSIPLATMGTASYYHGLYFPQHFETHFRREVLQPEPVDLEVWSRLHRHLLAKVSIHQGHRPLLIKNPVYTGYVHHLRELWPQAKFIHIYRNPYRVFSSTRHFFTRLLPELALQSYGNLPIEPLILESYVHLMQRLQADTADLPPHQFIEIRFEDLETQPLQALETLFQQLRLPEYKTAYPPIKTYLYSLKGYRKNEYTLDPRTIAQIETHWCSYIDKWDYSVPETVV
ncbi:MAG: sulfotransferase [Leptolyngbya sp. SIO1D8]|nr:sulfotransferase [Leptolyngbya sp. SIO1D8]